MQPHEPGRLGIGIKTQVPSLFNGLGVWKNVWLAARRIHSAQQTDRITRKTLELIGALRATAGQLTFNGTDVTRAARQSRAALGMACVPQGRHLSGL